MTLDTITLSRLQFAFTIGYHILWPAYSIGIAGFIVLLNAIWLLTGKTVYGIGFESGSGFSRSGSSWESSPGWFYLMKSAPTGAAFRA